MGYKFRTPGPWGAGTAEDLDPADVDNNFWQAIQDIAAKAAAGVGISNIVQSGNELTFVLTDHTLLGPYTLPVVLPKFKGEWLSNTNYLAGDIFSHGGSTYGVNYNHLSDATFDPGKNDGFGNDAYTLLLANPTITIPTGGADGTFLRKVGTVDFVAGWLTASLNDLSDVNIPASPPPINGEVLTYLSGVWKASAATSALAQLSDVSIDSPAPSAGQVLTWNGLVWTNDNATGFFPLIASPVAGQLLSYNGTDWTNQNTANIPVVTISNVFGSISLDYSLAAVQRMTMTGDTVLTGVTNWPTTGKFARLLIEIINGGAYTWQWPTAFKWSGGAQPEVSISGRDIFALTTFDGGVNVSGSVIGQNYQ